MAAAQNRAARLIIANIDDWEKGIDDAKSDELVVLNVAKEAGIIKNNKKGETLRRKYVTDRGVVDAMTTEATSTFTPTNPGLELAWGWKGYKTTDAVHELDTVTAADANAVFDIMQNRVLWMPEAIGRAFCIDTYIGDGSTDAGYGTNSIIGWDNSIISTGTYAGQSVTANTAFAGQVLSGGVHASFSTDPFKSLTPSVIACMRGKDAGMGSHFPTHILIDPTGFGYLLNASNDLRRDDGDSSKKKYGTRALTFMDLDIVMDRLAPALKYYTINMKTQEVHTPFPKGLIQTRRESKLSPLSENLLAFVYCRWVNKLPRANARTTYA